jgi:hypothetical protein
MRITKIMSDLILPVGNQQPISSGALVEQKKAEGLGRIQSALIIAKQFPRNQNAAFTTIMESCKRISLAEKSLYKYTRGSQLVTGPSIRLAEAIASAWGNINYGFQELEQNDGKSTVEAFCHDLETNTLITRSFVVQHKIDLKGGKDKILTAEREIYEKVANSAQRRVRATILEVIPGDVVEAAVLACQETLKKGGGVPIADRIRKLVFAFKAIGVDQVMIERKLGHGIDLTTEDEIVDLSAIYTSIRDKQANREDFFDFASDNNGAKSDGKAASLSDRLKQKIEENIDGEKQV